MRLIDADALWTDIMMLPHNEDMISSEEVELAIMDAPTVDAVEVVRCKDCKKMSPSVTAIKGSVWCREFRAYMPCDGFCSYGERRDNGR